MQPKLTAPPAPKECGQCDCLLTRSRRSTSPTIVAEGERYTLAAVSGTLLPRGIVCRCLLYHSSDMSTYVTAGGTLGPGGADEKALNEEPPAVAAAATAAAPCASAAAGVVRSSCRRRLPATRCARILLLLLLLLLGMLVLGENDDGADL